MLGNATIKAKPQEFNQIVTIFSTIPTLKTLITKDIIHDISNAMKKENTVF
jgi:hypothetical protein